MLSLSCAVAFKIEASGISVRLNSINEMRRRLTMLPTAMAEDQVDAEDQVAAESQVH